MKKCENQFEPCFSAADILLPGEVNLQRWAVIACDQFTSQPDYWEQVKKYAQGAPSAYHLILPECDLNGDEEARIRNIQDDMLAYMKNDVFRRFPDCYIYTERTLRSGLVRKGLIGKVDLEQYDYSGTVDAAVRATEQTVTERIPPRMAVRRGASLELPHVLLLCDDERCQLIEALGLLKDSLPKLYDFDLMLGGGHISGWLVSGEAKRETDERLLDYARQEREKHPDQSLLFAVGDGNHSLATAKACFEEMKKRKPGDNWSNHPARYALCELNNIHDPCQLFEPIHRIVKNCEAERLIRDMTSVFSSECGEYVQWVSGEKKGYLCFPTGSGKLTLAWLQDYLDAWIAKNGGDLDYIHGDENLTKLAQANRTVGFLLPPIRKESLFPGILSGGVLPRKTFSMGDAEEKRYYLEARRIIP